MYERNYAPGFHDLISELLRMTGLFRMLPRPQQRISTLISLVDAHIGIAIRPASAVKIALIRIAWHRDQIPMYDSAMVVNQRGAAVVDNFRSLL